MFSAYLITKIRHYNPNFASEISNSRKYYQNFKLINNINYV